MRFRQGNKVYPHLPKHSRTKSRNRDDHSWRPSRRRTVNSPSCWKRRKRSNPTSCSCCCKRRTLTAQRRKTVTMPTRLSTAKCSTTVRIAPGTRGSARKALPSTKWIDFPLELERKMTNLFECRCIWSRPFQKIITTESLQPREIQAITVVSNYLFTRLPHGQLHICTPLETHQRSHLGNKHT